METNPVAFNDFVPIGTFLDTIWSYSSCTDPILFCHIYIHSSDHYLVSLCIVSGLATPDKTTACFLQVHNNYVNNGEDSTLQEIDHVPEQFFEDGHHLTIAFNYYDCAYGSFLAGQDEFPEEREVFEGRYGKRRNCPYEFLINFCSS